VSRGLFDITNVAALGGGVYRLTVSDSTGMAVADHVGTRITDADTGPGGLWAISAVNTGTEIEVSDTLTEENGGTFGAPLAGATGRAWYSTPSTEGMSRPPHLARAWDAAERRNAYQTLVVRIAKNPNLVLAGPAAGPAAVPTFRALVAADIPSLSASYVPVARAVNTDATSGLTGGGALSIDRTISFGAQAAAKVLAGPTSGGAAVPTFRSLVAGDIPALSYVSPGRQILTSATSGLTGGGDLSADRTISFGAQAANLVLAGPTSGGTSVPTFRSLVQADLTALSLTFALGHNTLANQQKQTGSTRTYTVPANYLLNTDSGFEADIYGIAGVSNTDINVTLGGKTLLDDADFDTSSQVPPGETWHLRLIATVISGNQLRVRYTMFGNGIETGSDVYFGNSRAGRKDPDSLSLTVDQDLVVTDAGGGTVSDLLVRYIGVLPADALVDHGDTTGTPTPVSATCPTFWSVQQRSGAAPSLQRISGATTPGGVLDTTIGTNETGTQTNARFANFNDAREYRGRVYWINTATTATHNIYSRPVGGTGGGAPTLERTFTYTVASHMRTGLYVVNGLLCFAFLSGTTTPRLVTYDGTTWSDTNPSAVSITAGILEFNKFGSCVNNNVLYVSLLAGTAADGILAFTVLPGGASTCSKITVPVSGTATYCAMVAFQNRVFYMSGGTNSSVQRQLYEVVGGTLVSRITLTSTNSDASTIGASAGCLFPVSDTQLCCIYPSNKSGGTTGTSHYRVSLVTVSGSTFTEGYTNVGVVQGGSDTTIPSLFYADAGSNTYSLFSWTDTETDPSAPATYVWYTSAIASNYSFFQYLGQNGDPTGTACSFNGRDYSLVAGHDGGGDVLSPDDVTDVVEDTPPTLTRDTAKYGCMTLTSKMQLVGTPSSYSAKVWIKTTKAWAWAVATLTDPSGGLVGCTRTGNVLSGITDNTTWSVDLDFTSMGVGNTAPIRYKVAYYP
jgi:hypothetical protein